MGHWNNRGKVQMDGREEKCRKPDQYKNHAGKPWSVLIFTLSCLYIFTLFSVCSLTLENDDYSILGNY